MPSIIKKITVRTVGISVADIKEALEGVASVDVMSIVGVSNEARPGTSTYGTFLKLAGDFAATNMLTGESFTSGTAILPEFVSNQLGTAIMENGSVEFGVVLTARNHPTSTTGYEFTVKSLMETTPSDKMAKLLALQNGYKSEAPQLALESAHAAPVVEVNAETAEHPAKVQPKKK